MTVWKPSVETVLSRRLPKTVRGWKNFELKQVGHSGERKKNQPESHHDSGWGLGTEMVFFCQRVYVRLEDFIPFASQ